VTRRTDRSSKATELVEIAIGRYRLGCSSDGTPFAVELAGPNVALSLKGRGGLRVALAAEYFAIYEEAAGQNALSEAMAVVEGKATMADREPVALRMAEHDGTIVVDLGRPDGQVVIIEPGKWTVAKRSPVLFRSTAVVGEIPLPVRKGGVTLGPLRALLNVHDDDWPVVLSMLVAGFMPRLAHPILLFSGEQGTAKSWASRIFVRCIDGSVADVECAPERIEDWHVVAAGSWTVALDNVSFVPRWLADAMCRASTGAISRKRALFTDDDLAVLRILRVVVLNGINPPVTRGDLAERLVRIDLEPVRARRTDEEIEASFTRDHPRIMAGFATWWPRCSACCPPSRYPTLRVWPASPGSRRRSTR
jgi:hypothetical protein